jgi:cytochrome c oxidase subunit 2
LLPNESNPASNSTGEVDFLMKFMLVFGLAITFYVCGYIIYFAVVFRRRRDEPITTVGVPIHDHPKLEFWWIAIPTLLLIVLMILSTIAWKDIQFPSTPAALTMEVVAHQFNFEFRYPGMQSGVFSPKAEMHLPAGKAVRILITSGDVIHQFWVPDFRVKIAAVPGLVTELNLTPTRTGTYDISCSEFCGVNHSLMQAKLVVDQPADFEKWVAVQRAAVASAGGAISLSGGSADAGKALFDQRCSACHNAAPFDQKKVGPGLANLTNDAAHPTLVDGKAPTPDDIAEILQKGFSGPIGVMPSEQANGISDKDIADLVAYLVSLK